MKAVRTARGKIIDMGGLQTKYEKTRAVSNVPVNARGDIIDSRGDVKVNREKISKEFYKDTVLGVEEQVSIKEDKIEPVNIPETPEVMQTEPVSQTVESETQIEELSRRQRTRKDGTKYWEIEYTDGSIQTLESE